MPSLRSRLNAAKCEKVPAGWYTRDEIAAREGYGSAEVAHRSVISPALAAGLLEKRMFLVRWGDAIRRRPHYRYVK